MYMGAGIVYREPLETSQSNRNLTASLWFDRRAAVLWLLPDGRCWRAPIHERRAKELSSEFQVPARFAPEDVSKTIAKAL